jgi:hypothetical protein
MTDGAVVDYIENVQRQRVPNVKASSLSELIPKTYSTVKARVLVLKAKEKEDALGKRSYLFGICEDQTFRSPFICYKPYPYFFRDAVFDFKDCYVHEFDDKSLLLIATERSSIDYLINEDPAKYIWNPRIGDVKRPMGTCRVTLQGVLSQISSSSGLVQRCEECGRVAFEAKCPNGHEGKLYWAVRVAGRISDKTGSMNVVFPQHLACNMLGRTIGEVLRLAEGPANYPSDNLTESFPLNLPDQMEIGEAYAEEPDRFRSANSPVVVDLNDSRIIYENNWKPHDTFGHESKKLDLTQPEDRRDLLRLTEKLLQIRIRHLTQLPKVNGIFLVENPIELYRPEKAKLFVGFKLKLGLGEDGLLRVDALPSAEAYESLLDYVVWRRSRGASPHAIKNTILNYRANVVFAPNGEFASVVNLAFKKAKDFTVPVYELNLSEFWKRIHDLEVDADETPLIVAKSYRFDLELTFPPSCVFFDKQSLRISFGTQSFIDRKRHQARERTREVLSAALSDFSIGDFKLPLAAATQRAPDAREVLVQDIRDKLLGKTVKATGSVIQANKNLYFIPRTVDGVF